jgi:hypothetical protein
MSVFSANFPASQKPDLPEDLRDLFARLGSEPDKKQLLLVDQAVEAGSQGLELLLEFLLERREQSPTPLDGKIYQALLETGNDALRAKLAEQLSAGLVPLRSDRAIDYSSLQTLLSQRDYEAADRMTLTKLCELAGTGATQRGWLYFTEVEQFPIPDLQTINTLWQVYSEGKFGFTVQRELWLGTGKNWERLWPLIGWKSGNNWTRYPREFTWDLSAPRGHLPLTNQLRGVRVMDALMKHPAWAASSISSG